MQNLYATELHRNTFINSPKLLNPQFNMRDRDNLYFAGQMTGVEGYIESAASGIFAGVEHGKTFAGQAWWLPCLIPQCWVRFKDISDPTVEKFQPMGCNMVSWPELPERIRDKKLKYKMIAERVLQTLTRLLRNFKENVMNIVIDAFDGDNAPLEVIKGSIDAQKDFGVDVTLVGDEEKIKKCAQENGLDITALHIKHADTVIEICEEPTEVIKGKKDCSMAVGMKMLADGEGDAFVSAGSTGALVVGATFIVKRIKGIKRPALATILPTATTPTMLLDSGETQTAALKCLLSLE